MLKGQAGYAGEGALHGLMRVVGLTQAAFLNLSGTSEHAFRKWYGHPMARWPVRLVEYYGWVQNMATYLRDRGVDPEQFRPRAPQAVMPTGRYPRTDGQLDLSKLPVGPEFQREGEGRDQTDRRTSAVVLPPWRDAG